MSLSFFRINCFVEETLTSGAQVFTGRGFKLSNADFSLLGKTVTLTFVNIVVSR